MRPGARSFLTQPARIRGGAAAAVAALSLLSAACGDGETRFDPEKERDFKPGTLESPREEAN